MKTKISLNASSGPLVMSLKFEIVCFQQHIVHPHPHPLLCSGTARLHVLCHPLCSPIGLWPTCSPQSSARTFYVGDLMANGWPGMASHCYLVAMATKLEFISHNCNEKGIKGKCDDHSFSQYETTRPIIDSSAVVGNPYVESMARES